MNKAMNPPRTATLTAQLRWHLRHADETPFDVGKATGIHSSSLYRFLGESRGLSEDAMDRLAKYLRLRLIRD